MNVVNGFCSDFPRSCRTVPQALSDKRATRDRRAKPALYGVNIPPATRQTNTARKFGPSYQPPPRKTEMKTIATLAAAVCFTAFTFSAYAAEDAAKVQKEQAESTYKMAKKQAAADEKSDKAQCKTMSGDAEKQCKKDATAKHDKNMADAKDAYTKAKADYKAEK
jgi:hypothetical protein